LYKPSGYWDFNNCKEEALKYETTTKFKKNSPSAYSSAKKHNYLNVITTHMKTIKHNPIGYWSFEKCKEEALKYEYKKDFTKNSSVAYTTISKNKWIDTLCSHMIESKKPSGYWTKEKCYESFLTCETMTIFKKEFSRAYSKSYKMNWIKEFQEINNNNINN